MMFKYAVTLLVILACLSNFAFAQEQVDLQVIQKIKQEAIQNSKVMETIIYLADVHGPRLTGSPGFRQAAEWAAEQLKEWGMQNVALEEWGTFGRGWTMEKVSLEMIEPRYIW
jgi:carboxypeptidase Q